MILSNIAQVLGTLTGLGGVSQGAAVLAEEEAITQQLPVVSVPGYLEEDSPTQPLQVVPPAASASSSLWGDVKTALSVLLRPSLKFNSAGESGETQEVRRKVGSQIRRQILRQVSQRTFRSSPSSPLLNMAKIVVTVDLKTGRLVDEGAAKQLRDYVQIGIILLPGENVMGLTSETRKGLEQALPTFKDPFVRGVLLALLDFSKVPIERDDAVGESLSPNVLRDNKVFMEKGLKSQEMTICANVEELLAYAESGRQLISPLSFRIATLWLTQEGRIIGMNQRMPLKNSPRGTEYHQGVLGTGTPVNVVLYCNNALVWHSSLHQLGLLEQQAIRSLYESARETRLLIKRERPEVLQGILRDEKLV